MDSDGGPRAEFMEGRGKRERKGKGSCGEGEKWMGLEGVRWVTALKGQKEFPYMTSIALGKPVTVTGEGFSLTSPNRGHRVRGLSSGNYTGSMSRHVR
ncbi:hypothetical protein BY996DRAFT_6457084 [Phakopsora pachyrhizi]|nr:hypothetical protein BY996DRAFT_6457084 [Phakopsora pachyrhizi]